MSDRVAPEVETVGWIMTWELRTNEWASTIGEDKWEPIVRFSKEPISELCRSELLSNKRIRSLSDPIPLMLVSAHTALLAENEKLRGVVEAVRVAYREVSDQMRILPQPLHFALAEMDRVMSRAALSKGGDDEH